jgi:hypothetical protein
MRTTIRLDDTLLRRAKAQAAATGRSLNDFISDAVRAALTPRSGSAARRVDLPTFKGKGLLPGVDLDDSAALLELTEREESYVRASGRPAKVAERPKRSSK